MISGGTRSFLLQTENEQRLKAGELLESKIITGTIRKNRDVSDCCIDEMSEITKCWFEDLLSVVPSQQTWNCTDRIKIDYIIK